MSPWWGVGTSEAWRRCPVPRAPGCSVALPCPTAGVGVPRGARGLPPAPARELGCTGAAGTQPPRARGDVGGCFGRCTSAFTGVNGQGFPQWVLGPR